jgi:plastocyanin
MRIRGRNLLVVGVVAVLAMFVLAACGGDDDSSSSSGNTPKLSGSVTDKGTKTVSGSSIEIEADDFYFKPTFVDAKPGTKLTVELNNEGKNTHTFTIDSAKIDQQLDPGKKATVQVTVPSSGNLNFYCRFHRGSGMQGAIVAKG